MRAAPEYTQRARIFGRIYLVALGLGLAIVGALAAAYLEAPLNWAGGALAVAGIAVLLYAVSKPGNTVANSAKNVVEAISDE